MTGSAQIIRGNALALPLADSSVDLVVTSPPYFGLRSYQDGGEHYDGQIGAETTPAEFVDALIAATREMVRVLKPSGSIFVNLGDKYASQSYSGGLVDQDQPKYRKAVRPPRQAVAGLAPKSLMGIPWRYALRCIDDLSLILRAEIIWAKPNGLPESVTDRVRRSHETWFHFTKMPRYFSTVDEIREPHSPKTYSEAARGAASEDRSIHLDPSRMSGGLKQNYTPPPNPLGKLPGSVWSIATQPLQVPDHLGVDHFAAFPMEWPRRIIRAWSPEGGTVLDPFGGTGTTALIAKSLGRNGISNDMSADYCRLAEWRTTDPGQMAAALQVEKPEVIHPDQLALFGDVA